MFVFGISSEAGVLFIVSRLSEARNAEAAVYLYVAVIKHNSDNLLTQPIKLLKPNTLNYQKIKTSLFINASFVMEYIKGNGKRLMRRKRR